MHRASHRQGETAATIFPEVEAKTQPLTCVLISVSEQSPGPKALIKYFGMQKI